LEIVKENTCLNRISDLIIKSKQINLNKRSLS